MKKVSTVLDPTIILLVWGGLMLALVVAIGVLIVVNRRRSPPTPRPPKYHETLEGRFAAMRANRRASAKRLAPRDGDPPAAGPRASS